MGMASKFLVALAIVAFTLCQINSAFPQGTIELDDELSNELQEEPHRQVRSVLNVANPAQNLQNERHLEPSLTGNQGGTKDSVYVRKTGPNRKVRSSRWVKFRDRILKGRGCRNGRCQKPAYINWSYKF